MTKDSPPLPGAAHEPERRAPARHVDSKQVRAELELGAPIAIQRIIARMSSGNSPPVPSISGFTPSFVIRHSSFPHCMSTSRLDRLLGMARDYEASDLHIIVGVPPSFRVNGEILLAEDDALAESDTEEMALQLLSESQRDKFERDWELCISLRHPVAGRVRVTFYKRNGHPEMSFRFCGDRVVSREELGLPAKIDDMARRPNGLFLITGPPARARPPRSTTW